MSPLPPGGETTEVATPEDIVALRRADPAAATRWRRQLRAELGALAAGGEVVGFTRSRSWCGHNGHKYLRELREVMLPLVSPFRTSFGTQTTRRVLIVRAEAEHDGAVVEGWGECVAADDPTYSSEYVDGAALTITTQLVPRLHRHGPVAAVDVAEALAPVKGHPMAKAALEMAILDAELRAAGRSFADYLGTTRPRVPSGVSVGIHDSIDALLATVEGYLADGYRAHQAQDRPGGTWSRSFKTCVSVSRHSTPG